MFFSADKAAVEAAGARMRTLRVGSIVPLTESTPSDTQLAEIAITTYLSHLLLDTTIEKMVACIYAGLGNYAASVSEEESQHFASSVDLLVQITLIANSNSELDALEVALRKLFNTQPTLCNGPSDILIRVLALLLCSREVKPIELENAVAGQNQDRGKHVKVDSTID